MTVTRQCSEMFSKRQVHDKSFNYNMRCLFITAVCWLFTTHVEMAEEYERCLRCSIFSIQFDLRFDT